AMLARLNKRSNVPSMPSKHGLGAAAPAAAQAGHEASTGSRATRVALRRSFVTCITIVTAFQMRLVAAGSVTENVPVPGGTVAMARALDIAPTPERARFLAEAARLTHPSAESANMTRAKAASTLSRMNAVAAARTAMAAAETVPIPLTVAVWSQAVFH